MRHRRYDVRGLRSPAGLLVAVAAVLLGVLAMHGLSLHGTASPAMSEMSSPVGDAARASPSSVGAMTGHPAQVQTGPVGHSGHAMGDMANLCLALLAGAAGAWVSLLVARRASATSFVLAPRLDRVVARAGRLVPRGAGPPASWAFSVIRC